MKLIPKYQNAGKIEQNKRKQAFLNANGYNIPVDGSWGKWQQEQYDKLTRKDKHYNTTPLGLLSYLYDATLGEGTTYQEDPQVVSGYTGEIKSDDRSAAKRWLSQQMNDNTTPLGYITQTVAPAAATAGAIVYGGVPLLNAIGHGIKAAVTNPQAALQTVKALPKVIKQAAPSLAKTFAKETAKGLAGASAVNVGSKLTTGKTWGQHIGELTGLSESAAEFTNPGWFVSPIYSGATRLFPKSITQGLTKYNKIRKINKELNKNIKENSIIESYNKIAANKDIGTVYDYLDFLDNIFPKSKMNDVYYHGGPKGIIQFKSAKNLGRTNKGINSCTKDYGIYFADDKELAKYYASSHPKSNREVYTVKLNMANPVKIKTNNWYLDKFKGTQDFAFDPGSITQKWYDKLNLKQYNGIYHNGKNPFSDGEIVVFNPKDIHIMGTPQESVMFREYKRFPIKRQVQFNEDIPTMQQQYDFGLKNIIKAAQPGVVLGGMLSVPPGLLIHTLNERRNKERSRKKEQKKK